MMRLQRNSHQVHGISLQTSATESGAFVAVLIVGKLVRSFGLFSAAEILKTFPVILLISISTALSAGVYVTLQKPFQKGVVRLRPHDYRDICKHALLSMAEAVLFTVGLMIVGPLRAVVISEHSDWAILGMAAVATHTGTVPAFHVRSAMVGLLAFAIMVWFDDPSGGGHAVDQLEQRSDVGLVAHHTARHNRYFGLFPVSDRTAAMFTLLLSACFRIARENFGRKVSARIGGAKRLNAISSLAQAATWVPFVIVEYFIGNAGGDGNPGVYYSTASMLAFTFCSLVVNFYSEKAAGMKIRADLFRTVALLTIFVGCGVLEGIWQKEESIELSTIISTLLILVGQQQWHLSRSTVSRGTTAEESGRKGSLIGYAPDGLPLYSFSRPRLPTKSIMKGVSAVLKSVQDNSESRQIFYFLCVNFVLMNVEFLTGVWSNSMVLISDAFHMLFDCAALVVGLYASITVRTKPPKNFPYGYGRFEVLSGFTNSILLITVAGSIFIEGVGRLSSPPQVQSDRLVPISCIGLVVNLIGLFGFSHTTSGPLFSQRDSVSKRASTAQSAMKMMKRPFATPGGVGATFGTPARMKGGFVTPGASRMRGSSLAATPMLPGSRFAQTRYASPGDLEAVAGAGPRSFSSSSAQAGGGAGTGTAGPASIFGKQSNPNLHGVLLHILADSLGSLGTIVSAVLVDQMGWLVVDPICSIAVSIVIMASVVPLLTSTGKTLLNRVPGSLSSSLLLGTLDHVKRLEGVVGYREVHVWEHAKGVLIGSLHVVVVPGSNEQRVLNQVTALFKDIGITNLTVQVEAQDTRAASSHGAGVYHGINHGVESI